MKILQICPYYAPAWAYGGPPRVMFSFAKGLVSKGHEVTVYTTDAYDENSRIGKSYDILEGVKIHYFRNVSNHLAYKKRVIPAGFRNFLKKHINGFDIVHISDTRAYLSLFAYLYSKKMKIPLVLSAHGTLPRRKGGLKRIYDYFFVNPMIRDSSLLVAQTEHEAQVYREFAGIRKSIRLIPLPIDMTEFASLPEKGLFRRKYGITKKDKVLLFLGRIHRFKGVHLLIDLMKIVRNHDSNAKLVIVGREDGCLREVKDKVSEYNLGSKVVFAGPLYGKDRLTAYTDADVFVHTPIQYEETATASLEACACYTPVVVTKQASVPWLENYKAGFCVDCEVEKIARRIIYLLNNNDRLKTYSLNARKLIEDRFDSDEVVARIEEGFLDIIAAKRSNCYTRIYST